MHTKSAISRDIPPLYSLQNVRNMTAKRGWEKNMMKKLENKLIDKPTKTSNFFGQGNTGGTKNNDDYLVQTGILVSSISIHHSMMTTFEFPSNDSYSHSWFMAYISSFFVEHIWENHGNNMYSPLYMFRLFSHQITTMKAINLLDNFIGIKHHTSYESHGTHPSQLCIPRHFPSFHAFCSTLLSSTDTVTYPLVLLSLIYIQRLRTRNPMAHGSEGYHYRIFVVSLILSAKYLVDEPLKNRAISDISGISLDQLNKMELEFMVGLGYDLHVSSEEIEFWMKQVKMSLLNVPFHSHRPCGLEVYR